MQRLCREYAVKNPNIFGRIALECSGFWRSYDVSGVNCPSPAHTIRYMSVIQKHGSRLKQIADLTLKSNGFAYKSAVSVKKEQFPDKTYGEHFFPSGVYDALIIELGSGEGDNWWCVAFPPLCFVPDGDGETVAYKSWVKEQLDKIFD